MLDGVESFKTNVPLAPPFGADGAIVAIPASNEAERISACLAALAVQRDACGEPVDAGAFEIVIMANNCSDDTAHIARRVAETAPHPVVVVDAVLPVEQANAGWARKLAMDFAARRLLDRGNLAGIILTTDADSCVAPTWFAATIDAFRNGADCVAGYIDANAPEITRLGRAFLGRGRLEDCYLRKIAEIYALCDPQLHDPWPNHRVSAGASLAVSLRAYLAIGGLPPEPIGEDVALTRALERSGYKIRHAMDVCVSTSCRFDGRAKGGAADTMHYRHAVADAPCDDALEPALAIVKRALIQGRLRRVSRSALLDDAAWLRRLRLTREEARELASDHQYTEFAIYWGAVQAVSPVLAKRAPLHPSELPREIARAELALRLLRSGPWAKRKSVRVDRPDRTRSAVAEIA